MDFVTWCLIQGYPPALSVNLPASAVARPVTFFVDGSIFVDDGEML